MSLDRPGSTQASYISRKHWGLTLKCFRSQYLDLTIEDNERITLQSLKNSESTNSSTRRDQSLQNFKSTDLVETSWGFTSFTPKQQRLCSKNTAIITPNYTLAYLRHSSAKIPRQSGGKSQWKHNYMVNLNSTLLQAGREKEQWSRGLLLPSSRWFLGNPTADHPRVYSLGIARCV